jgi:hypothetical protein
MARPKHLNGGAPTKFKKEYVEQILKFFAVEPYIEKVFEQTKEFYLNGKIKKESTKTRPVPNKMPTLFSFSREIGVDYSTVWRWAEKGEDEMNTESLLESGKTVEQTKKIIETQTHLRLFRKAYNSAKQMQKEFLITIGLAGAAPPASFIFTAKNITDMRDSHDVVATQIVRDYKDLKDDALNQEIKRLQSEVGISAS